MLFDGVDAVPAIVFNPFNNELLVGVVIVDVNLAGGVVPDLIVNTLP